MNQKTRFCHGALADQIDQWQSSLERELESLLRLKNRVIGQDEGKFFDRVRINKQVETAVQAIKRELMIYKEERERLATRDSQFMELMNKYDQLSETFQAICQEARFAHQISEGYQIDDGAFLDEGENQKTPFMSIMSLPTKNHQSSVRYSARVIQQTEEDYQNFNQDEPIITQQSNNEGNKNKILNETFNSMQNRLISEQRIKELKSKNEQQRKSKPIELAIPQSEHFQKLNSISVSAKSNTKRRNSRVSNLSLNQIRSISPGLRNQSQTPTQRSSCERPPELSLSFRNKQQESNQACSVLERELNRIKSVVQDQQNQFSRHCHSQIEEEIKKYKIENAMMRTQCQILKDEHQELLLEFTKTKKVLDEQFKLSVELRQRYDCIERY